MLTIVESGLGGPFLRCDCGWESLVFHGTRDRGLEMVREAEAHVAVRHSQGRGQWP